VNSCVVDCSVMVKCFVQEPQSNIARDPFASRDELYAPDLILAEFSHAMTKNVRIGQISLDEAKGALMELRTDLVLSRVSVATYQHTVELALGTGNTAQDCPYLAVAEYLDVPVITADETFVAKVRKSPLPIPVIRLQDWPSSA
jgi:predicted nucleic acid-binding protein